MMFLMSFLLVTAPLAAPSPYVVKDYGRLIGMPGFSTDLLKMHFKLYEGYVKNTNELLAKLQALSGQATSYEYGALKRRLAWEFDGMRLHELYFGNLGGDGKMVSAPSLSKALATTWGSVEEWKKDFIATGLMRGIGWAVLYMDPQEKRLVNVWINEHDTGHLATGSPILIVDVFEHAYMPQFGLDRAKYIDICFQNLDWSVVEKRFTNLTVAAGVL
jgi:Fe-Mn family superoxide dismutase